MPSLANIIVWVAVALNLISCAVNLRGLRRFRRLGKEYVESLDKLRELAGAGARLTTHLAGCSLCRMAPDTTRFCPQGTSLYYDFGAQRLVALEL